MSGDVLLFLRAVVVSLLLVFFLWVMGCSKCDVYIQKSKVFVKTKGCTLFSRLQFFLLIDKGGNIWSAHCSFVVQVWSVEHMLLKKRIKIFKLTISDGVQSMDCLISSQNRILSSFAITSKHTLEKITKGGEAT